MIFLIMQVVLLKDLPFKAILSVIFCICDIPYSRMPNKCHSSDTAIDLTYYKPLICIELALITTCLGSSHKFHILLNDCITIYNLIPNCK